MDVMQRRRELMGMQGRLKTVSGPIVTVSDALARNAKSLVVNFAPVQSAGTPSPDNVRPISGWTGVTGYKTGANIWGGEKLADDIVARVPGAVKDTTNRTVTYTASNISGKTLFEGFKPNTQYTVILNGTGVSNLKFFYSSGNTTTLPGSISGGKAFKSDGTKNLASIMGEWNTGNTTLNYDQCGVFEGSLAVSDFVPYTGTTYPVDWTDVAGTIYGGYVDFVSGVLVADRAMVEYDGSSDESWFEYGVGSDNYCCNVAPSGKERGYQKSICNEFENVDNAWALSNYCIYSDHPNLINTYFRMPNADVNTKSEFLAWIAQHPIQLVYELATPITYQLTPQTIAMLRGTNSVWSNTNGNVELTYYAQ